MKKIIDLINSYRLVLIKILFYEIFHILLGFKGNSFFIRNDAKSTDTIPCSYFFLSVIYKMIKNENIKTFVDLGCGNGRVLYYLNKKLNFNYVGVELYKNSYDNCVKIFKNSNNVKILNKNFFDLDFDKHNFDCYFLNDPLKRLEDHNNLINSIIASHKLAKKNLIFVLANFTKIKYEAFESLDLKFEYFISDRNNIRIYKYKNIQ